MKIETEKIKKVSQIQGYKIRIELIKDTTKRETEDLRIGKVNKTNQMEKMKTEIKEIRIKVEFDESD